MGGNDANARRQAGEQPPAFDDMEDFASDVEWGVPEPLPSVLAVPILGEELLPIALRPWLKDISERMQVPLEFPAVGALVALGSLIGRRFGIRPKRHDDWMELPNLWGGIVGEPSLMKTPATGEALKPLRRLQENARKEWEEAKRRYAFDSEVYEVSASIRKEELKKAVKAGRAEEFRDDFSEPPAAPVLRRYEVNDPTVEKLGELLNQNPNGLLLFRDELSGFLRSLDKEGHENDRAFYLEAWAGTGGYTYDRIARGTIHIEAACVSILGTIQPGPLADYFRAALRGGTGNDGFVQRFQLLVWPDKPREWRNVDRWPDQQAKDSAWSVFERLDSLRREQVQSSGENEGIPFLRFAEDAQGAFDEWREKLENRLRQADEHPALVAQLAKYRKLVPALALIFHLVNWADSESTFAPSCVSPEALAMAIAWADFLEAHARRIYQAAGTPGFGVLHALARRLQTGALPQPFTARDVYRRGWAGLGEPEGVGKALETFEEMSWVKGQDVAPSDKGGRGKRMFRTNPAVLTRRKPAGNGADKTDSTQDGKVPSVSSPSETKKAATNGIGEGQP